MAYFYSSGFVPAHFSPKGGFPENDSNKRRNPLRNFFLFISFLGIFIWTAWISDKIRNYYTQKYKNENIIQTKSCNCDPTHYKLRQ